MVTHRVHPKQSDGPSDRRIGPKPLEHLDVVALEEGRENHHDIFVVRPWYFLYVYGFVK